MPLKKTPVEVSVRR